MDQNEIIEKFEKARTKRKIISHLYQYRIIWEFTGMREIVNLNEFILYMEMCLHVKVNSALESSLRTKINQLRDVFSGSNNLVWDYLGKLETFEFDIEVRYRNYLQLYYSYVKLFFLDAVIPYILYNLINKNHVLGGKEIDLEGVYLSQFRHFQIKVMKLEKDILKLLTTYKPEFEKLYGEFKEVITDAQKEAKKLEKIVYSGGKNFYD